MSKYQYEGSEKFRPITPWGYVGYTILFCIPLIGWILLIVFAFSERNINRRSFARSYFCHLLIFIILFAGLVALIHYNVAELRYRIEQWRVPFIREVTELVDKWFPTDAYPAAEVTGITGTEEAITNTPTESKASSQSSTKASGSATGVRTEVKEAIDSYEAFFKEYADFMKKYTKSSNPASMLEDYTTMLTRYAENMEKWNKLEDDYSMNDAEEKYYLDATQRIDKMLLDVI